MFYFFTELQWLPQEINSLEFIPRQVKITLEGSHPPPPSLAGVVNQWCKCSNKRINSSSFNVSGVPSLVENLHLHCCPRLISPVRSYMDINSALSYPEHAKASKCPKISLLTCPKQEGIGFPMCRCDNLESRSATDTRGTEVAIVELDGAVIFSIRERGKQVFDKNKYPQPPTFPEKNPLLALRSVMPTLSMLYFLFVDLVSFPIIWK